MSTDDSLSNFEEVALLIEATKNHLERLSNHRWNRFGPDGFELANEEIRGAIQWTKIMERKLAQKIGPRCYSHFSQKKSTLYPDHLCSATL